MAVRVRTVNDLESQIPAGLVKIDFPDPLLESYAGLVYVGASLEVIPVRTAPLAVKTFFHKVERYVQEYVEVRLRKIEISEFRVQNPVSDLFLLLGVIQFSALVGYVGINVTVQQYGRAVLQSGPDSRRGPVSVLGEEQRHKLGVNRIDGAEPAAKELAYEFSVNGRVISGEMYVFQAGTSALQIFLQLLDLSGFACSVQTFQYDEHISANILIFSLLLQRVTQIMGILNLSPDSFQKSGMGDLSILESELADIVDIGAVSTRPGADDVSEEQEWARLEPAMEKLREGRPFSLDTTRSSIVRRVFSLKGGFTVNDVSAGELDREMLPTVAELGLGYVAMHRRGNPRTMDLLCDYPDGVMAELLEFFRDFSLRAERAGLRNWILDPGLGFAKTPAQNMEILRNLDSLRVFGRPILVGPSHKRFTRGREGEVLSLCRRADIVRLHPDWIETFLQTSE